MTKISYDDFRRKDGSIDWHALRSAEIGNGDICYVCGRFADIFGGKGYRQKCNECTQMDGSGELDHEKYLRCPRCGYHWDPYEAEDYKVFEEDSHEVWCEKCDFKFEVSTMVTYCFTSPPRLKADGGD